LNKNNLIFPHTFFFFLSLPVSLADVDASSYEISPIFRFLESFIFSWNEFRSPAKRIW